LEVIAAWLLFCQKKSFVMWKIHRKVDARGWGLGVLQQENAKRHFIHKHEILQPNGGSKEWSKECRGSKM
jgi:hypothetical protein